MAVAVRVSKCYQLFGQVSMSASRPVATRIDTGLLIRIDEEFGRLKVWSNNIGANQTGQTSLDHRLREAKQLKNKITELLDNLVESLNDMLSIISGTKIPWDQEATSTSNDSDDETSEEADPHSHGLCVTGLSIANDGMAPTELDQIYSDVVEIITCLFRLSLRMRKPTTYEHFLASSSRIGQSIFSEFDKAHIRNKFPTVDYALGNRLGEANSHRREFFRYRRAHHDKINQDASVEHQETATVISSLPSELKDVNASPAMAEQLFEQDRNSDGGISQTSYATSKPDSARLRVPSLPAEYSDGTPFECQFCRTIVSVTSRKAWKRHIFTDLRPYVCLWGECESVDPTFASRRAWLAHMVEQHWRQWVCPFGCNETFHTRKNFKDHLHRFHPSTITKDQVEVLLGACEMKSRWDSDCRCPLCQDHIETEKEFASHVGRHLEDIALFTLREETQDGFEVGSNTEDGDHEVVGGDNEASEGTNASGVDRKNHNPLLSLSQLEASTLNADTKPPPAVLMRKLPRNTSPNVLHTMLLFAKDMIDVNFVDSEYPEDAGYLSAVVRFMSLTGAHEARDKLNGKTISNDAKLMVELYQSGITISAGRRNTGDETLLRHASSSASSAGSSGGQRNPSAWIPSSRFNGTFQSLEKMSPPSGTGEKLPAPESNATIQSLFSPQSPIPNSALSNKSIINDDPGDETSQLLNNPVAFAKSRENSQMPFARSKFEENLQRHDQRHDYPPVNPTDQNPPCDTLYVGNLPVDTSEDELKAIFSKQQGYKRLLFRTKQNGPMCFVEFEDTSVATKALNELYGYPLHNSTKGGIRLSFSKNPLGVRSGRQSSNVLQSPMNPRPGMQGMGGAGGVPTGFSTAIGPPPGLQEPPQAEKDLAARAQAVLE